MNKKQSFCELIKGNICLDAKSKLKTHQRQCRTCRLINQRTGFRVVK